MESIADGKKRYEGMDADRLRHLLAVRDRQAIISREFWLRAAKAALNGDLRDLRNRVDLAEADPVDIVLSGQ